MIGVRRSAEALAILTQGRAKDRYRSREVVDRLVEDFHDKCYICEIRPLQGRNVEHLHPHKHGKFPERMFNWNNLFLSCPHCNNVKAKPRYDESMNTYQHVWVVFDKDDFGDFDEAIELAANCGFNVAWSNQSFEYWLCLHFDYLDEAFDRSQYCSRLSSIFKRKRINSAGYRKNMPNIYELVTIHGDVDHAIENAKKRRREFAECFGTDSRRSDWDPCTTVDLLVAELNAYLQ